MTVEREYKVGDRICTFNDKGVVVKLNKPFHPDLNLVVVKWDNGSEAGISESQVWHEGGTPKFDYMRHQAKLEHEERLRLAAERHKVERAFDEEIKAYRGWIKYPVGARVRWVEYGCGTVVKTSPFVLTVMFANNYERDVSAYPPLKFATAEDEQYDACAVLWAPEPLDEAATLDELESEVSRWVEVVKFIDGDEDDEEIRHDLFVRECLHGTLNGLKKQGIAIPETLLQTLEEADQYYLAHSVEDNPSDIDDATYFETLKKRSPCRGPVTVHDSKLFWYQGRWPKSKSSGK